MNGGVQNILKSRTVRVCAVGLVFALMGIDLDKLEQGQIADQVDNIITAVTLIAGIYYRYKAKKQLSFKVKSKE